MPKLRGIDTRGDSRTKCLDKLLSQIDTGIGGNPFNLREDFNLACELGYGQFIWQTANYLREMETTKPSSPMEAGTVRSDATEAGRTELPVGYDAPAVPAPAETLVAHNRKPPDTFMPNDPDRSGKWGRLSDAKKQKYLTSAGEDVQ
jgi:hypothetical protein